MEINSSHFSAFLDPKFIVVRVMSPCRIKRLSKNNIFWSATVMDSLAFIAQCIFIKED